MKKDYNLIAIVTTILILFILGITLVFKLNSYKITFIVNNEIYKTIEARKNKILNNVPRPERDGFAFIGWYDQNGNLFDEKIKIQNNEVYYARWAEIITDDEKDN